MRNLYYILILIFLYSIAGGIEIIAFRIESDLIYLIETYQSIIEYFSSAEPVG